MPDQARYKMTFAGSYSTVPFSFSTSYKQLGADIPGKTTFQVLLDWWFNEVDNLWSQWNDFLSEDVKLECVTITEGTNVNITYVNNRAGTVTGICLPTDLAIQVNIYAEKTHPASAPGRFFIPGFETDNCEFGCVKQAASNALQPVLQDMKEYTVSGTPFLILLPHIDFQPSTYSADVASKVPWIEPAIKRLKSRALTPCGAFSGGASNIGLPGLPDEPPLEG